MGGNRRYAATLDREATARHKAEVMRTGWTNNHRGAARDSISPRATWVWAVHRGRAEVLQAALSTAGHQVSAARGGNADSRTLDLDIGVVELAGLQFLIDGGYSFRWHPRQHPLNRAEHQFGIPVSAT